MKLSIIFSLIGLLITLFSCKEKGENSYTHEESENVDSKSQPSIPLTDCIHNALYYLDNTDISTYDSIDTHYFHEILGYTNEQAKELEKDLNILKLSILSDTKNNLGQLQKEEIQTSIENLRYQLYSYEKSVIGYVFIHTYSIKEDTLSAIILMTKNCSSSEAIPVNAIKDIDPSDYSYKVQQIESNL